MANYCCYSYYMSEFVTNVIKLIQDVKFFVTNMFAESRFFIHGAYTVCKSTYPRPFACKVYLPLVRLPGGGITPRLSKVGRLSRPWRITAHLLHFGMYSHLRQAIYLGSSPYSLRPIVPSWHHHTISTIVPTIGMRLSR